MKVQYVAEDGSIFGSKSECRTYELCASCGSDAEFVNAVDKIFGSLVSTDDRGNRVIPFDDELDKVRFCTKLGAGFTELRAVFKKLKSECEAKLPEPKRRLAPEFDK
jgi:hypothetical protein